MILETHVSTSTKLHTKSSPSLESDASRQSSLSPDNAISASSIVVCPFCSHAAAQLAIFLGLYSSNSEIEIGCTHLKDADTCHLMYHSDAATFHPITNVLWTNLSKIKASRTSNEFGNRIAVDEIKSLHIIYSRLMLTYRKESPCAVSRLCCVDGDLVHFRILFH